MRENGWASLAWGRTWEKSPASQCFWAQQEISQPEIGREKEREREEERGERERERERGERRERRELRFSRFPLASLSLIRSLLRSLSLSLPLFLSLLFLSFSSLSLLSLSLLSLLLLVIEMEVMSLLGCTATVTEVQPSVWDKIAF